MKTTLGPASARDALARLREANRAFSATQRQPEGTREPVHVVYGGAQLFAPGLPAKFGRIALTTMAEAFPDDDTFAEAFGLGANAGAVRARVARKLEREPVEDSRIDFEDGYGNRPSAQEDADALKAADAMAEAFAARTLPAFTGIRIKPLTEELRERALRTLDLFVTRLVERTGGRVPPNFVVTLPKVTLPEQVHALAEILATLERSLSIPDYALGLEIMVELPAALLDAHGRLALPALVQAAGGRCAAAHFGTYDYTAALDVTAHHQDADHPAADFARQLMKASLAGTGVRLSDGATTTLPVAIHRGAELTAAQRDENRAAIVAASRLHFDHVRRALREGFYQGWDLHPAQLPARYAAVFSFFLEGLEATTRRLRQFLDRAAQATLAGTVFDDAATGQGLLNFFLRGLACGALSEEEVAAAGLTVEELRTRSFLAIVERRRG